MDDQLSVVASFSASAELSSSERAPAPEVAPEPEVDNTCPEHFWFVMSC